MTGHAIGCGIMQEVDIAQALAAIGRQEEAQFILRRILSGAPETAPVEWPRAAAALSMLLLPSGRFQEAVTLAEQAIAHAPHDPLLLAVHRQIGMTLYRDMFYEEALPWLERAAELEPWDKALAAMLQHARPRDYLTPEIEDPVTGRVLRRYNPREGSSYIYVIDIVGTCNLRCPTCPVGNSELGTRPRGMMKPAMFREIIAKIRRESPSERPEINLFNWGEPLLHPQLPSFIQLLRESGMVSKLSTNLNIRHGLDAVVRAAPDDLKVSLSGFSPDSYGRTHTGGDLALVQRNLRALREAIDRHKVGTHVWVSHHLYRNNLGETDAVRAMCAELRFAYRPIQAFYMPLERLQEYLDGRPNPLDHGIIAELLTDPRVSHRMIQTLRSGKFDCELRFNQTVINHDGSVALCCTVYDQENMLGVDFLGHDHAEIERRKYAHPFCAKCFKAGTEYTRAELRPVG